MAAYSSEIVVPSDVSGWLVGWISNQLVQRLPQWPQVRIVPGQSLHVAIDPKAYACDSDPSKVQLAAIVKPDERPEHQVVELLLPFPPFKHL